MSRNTDRSRTSILLLKAGVCVSVIQFVLHARALLKPAPQTPCSPLFSDVEVTYMYTYSYMCTGNTIDRACVCRLPGHLTEHLNSEIVLKSIKDIESLLAWTSSTFFSVVHASHAHTRTQSRTRTYTYTPAYTHKLNNTHTHFAHTLTHVHLHKHTQTHRNTHTHTQIHIRTHTHIRTLTHTHTHTLSLSLSHTHSFSLALFLSHTHTHTRSHTG